MRVLEEAFNTPGFRYGLGVRRYPSISCKELTMPRSRAGEVKDLGRVASEAMVFDFPLVVGDDHGDATEMRSRG